MASVITQKLCSSAVRSRLFTCITNQPYQCYFLTKLDVAPRSNYLVHTFQQTKTKSSIYTSIRQYSSHHKNSDLNENDVELEGKKLSLFQRFKKMYRDYWYVLVPVHLVTSAAWFGGFYYLASSGVDIPALLESWNFSERIVNSMRNSSMGYLAISYGLYKIATPARYAITLGGTTLSIQYLKKWGYIKPMPSKERLKEIYQETREGMKEKTENIRESVQNLKESVKETKEGIKEKKDNILSSVKDSKDSIKKKVISSTKSQSK